MKSSFRKADLLLPALAVIAGIFCVWMNLRLRLFPEDAFAAREEALHLEIAGLREQTARALSDEERRLKELREDLPSLGAEGMRASARLDALREQLEEKKTDLSSLEEEVSAAPEIRERAAALRREYGLTIRALEEKIQAGESDVKICYWTFDDGPTRFTGEILDILSELGENVHVTFFTSREANRSDRDDADEPALLRRETAEGHSVQNHSYSHQYNGNVYSSLESFAEQIRLQEEWIYETTGFRPGIFRFPGGSQYSNKYLGRENCLRAVRELGYEWIDWSCNACDAGPKENRPSAEGEAQFLIWQVKTMPIAVILSHDWIWATRDALPIAIPKLQEMGYVFLPLFPESTTMGEATKILFP